ncbi:MAG: GntR family transcriptional regulator [Steroidobacteraceae bacterium]
MPPPASTVSRSLELKPHTNSLQPVARDTLQERVYLRIRQALILSEFNPGQVLTIRELAQKLGTSIMPVREALQKLTVERVLELLPTRSVRVPVLSAEEFAEICEARMLLEGHMARLAAERADADDLARIEQASRAFLSARVPSAPTVIQQRNREFHFAIYEAAHQPTMLELIEPLWVRCGPCTVALFVDLGSEKIKRGATTHHQQALEAIRARRPAAAEEAIVADIRATSERYQKYRREHAEFFGEGRIGKAAEP